jgi:hypothetical protein
MQLSCRVERIVGTALLCLACAGAAAWGDPPADAKKPWDDEIAAITNLLIDGNYPPVRERAVRLLENEDLPDDAVLRVQDLLATAAAKLRESSPAAPPPASEPSPNEPPASAAAPTAPSTAPEAQQDQDIEIHLVKGAPPPKKSAAADRAAAKSAEPAAAKTFRVRLAEIGGGFGPGSNGTLQLDDDGLRLVTAGKGKGWTIRWADLAAVQPDDGMWDSPYPLRISDRSGHSYFITRIDEKGRYLSGSPIVTAVSQMRKKRPAGDGR